MLNECKVDRVFRVSILDEFGYSAHRVIYINQSNSNWLDVIIKLAGNYKTLITCRTVYYE